MKLVLVEVELEIQPNTAKYNQRYFPACICLLFQQGLPGCASTQQEQEHLQVAGVGLLCSVEGRHSLQKQGKCSHLEHLDPNDTSTGTAQFLLIRVNVFSSTKISSVTCHSRGLGDLLPAPGHPLPSRKETWCLQSNSPQHLSLPVAMSCDIRQHN